MKCCFVANVFTCTDVTNFSDLSVTIFFRPKSNFHCLKTHYTILCDLAANTSIFHIRYFLMLKKLTFAVSWLCFYFYPFYNMQKQQSSRSSTIINNLRNALLDQLKILGVLHRLSSIATKLNRFDPL